jgi:hypothetical protein
MQIYQTDPCNLEDWEDLVSWKQFSDKAFFEACQLHFKPKITKVSQDYFLECLVDKKYSEISEIPNIYDKRNFVDESYEVCALFVDNKEKEMFFLLKKNNEIYGLDISKEYEFLIVNKNGKS